MHCLLKWTDKGNLEELVDVLLKRGYLRSKKELFKLFNNPGAKDMVRWNRDKLEYLALLIYRLYNEKYFIITKSKGYFLYAERHFADFNGKKMKRKELKNLSYEVNADKRRYSYVHKEIKEIIALIKNN